MQLPENLVGKYKMARKKTKRKAIYKRMYKRKSILGDITMGGVTAITGATLTGAVAKVI